MNISSTVDVTVLAKPQPSDWKMDNGQRGTTYKLTCQCGEDAGMVKVPEDVYRLAVVGMPLRLYCTFSEMRAKDLGLVYSMKITGAMPVKASDRADAKSTAPNTATPNAAK